MNSNQKILIEFLSLQDLLYKDLFTLRIQSLPTSNLAQLYVDNNFLNVFLKFVKEAHWIESQQGFVLNFKNFITPLLACEFENMSFLHAFLESLQIENLKNLQNKTHFFELSILKELTKRSYDEKIIFSQQVLFLISELFEFENKISLQKESEFKKLGFTLYRAYDSLDEVFDLSYKAEANVKMDFQTNERLYEGAGVGVQSGYSTVLTALRYLKPEKNSRFIDLGSGYGRIGIVIGLLRPDIDFIGYEYVPQRVDIANQSAVHFKIDQSVHFITQDLSSHQFQIPEAEIYYLYDPFSEATYKYVLDQLMKISQKKKIVIVTKGNARDWIMEITQKNGWEKPVEFDNRNLSLFSSR